MEKQESIGLKTVRKFLFETDFDDASNTSPRGLARKAKGEPAAAAEPPPPPPPPPEPTFSEADLAAASASGHAKGLKEGLAKGKAEAQAQIEAQIAAALGTITNQVAVMKAELTMDRATILGEAAGLALAMTRKMLPELTRRGGLAEVEAVIERCLVDLRREPRLTARIPVALLPELEAKIATLAADKHFEGRISLIGDATLTGASCHVEWADGGLERHGDAIWRQVSTALDRCLTLQGITPALRDETDPVATDSEKTAENPAEDAGENNVGSDDTAD